MNKSLAANIIKTVVFAAALLTVAGKPAASQNPCYSTCDTTCWVNCGYNPLPRELACEESCKGPCYKKCDAPAVRDHRRGAPQGGVTLPPGRGTNLKGPTRSECEQTPPSLRVSRGCPP
jgi:hypothetical protein